MTPPARGRGTSQRSPTVLVSYKLYQPSLPSTGNWEKSKEQQQQSVALTGTTEIPHPMQHLTETTGTRCHSLP